MQCQHPRVMWSLRSGLRADAEPNLAPCILYFVQLLNSSRNKLRVAIKVSRTCSLFEVIATPQTVPSERTR
ncbi:hypothetical protein HYQ44_013333 [Verticillium longisporum]|nr:hypothetical protein HYQ44_013333 [Verticillium longisporum]